MVDPITSISPSDIFTGAWQRYRLKITTNGGRIALGPGISLGPHSIILGNNNEPQHLTHLNDYLSDKENTGAVSEVKINSKPHAVVLFDTSIGFMRKVIEPWLREYVTTWRLCGRVAVELREVLPIGVRVRIQPFSRKEQNKMHPDQQVRVVLKIKAHYRKGTLHFLEGVKRKHGRPNTAGRTKAAERASRLAQRHASRLRARIVRRRCSRSR